MAGRSKELKISILALVASIAAIVLSQFHPLYTYLDKPRFVASVSTVQLMHEFGSPTLYVFTQLRNEGRAAGTITRVDAFIESANSHFQARLPSQTYFPIPTATVVGTGPPPVPWTGVTLGPDLSWSSYVEMGAMPSEADQMKVAALMQRAQTEMAANPAGPRRISDALFREITDFVNQKLSRLTVGNYFLLLLAFDEKSKTPVVAKCFSFALSQQDIGRFSLITEQIRTFSPPGPPIILNLSEITDAATLRRIRSDAAQGS